MQSSMQLDKVILGHVHFYSCNLQDSHRYEEYLVVVKFSHLPTFFNMCNRHAHTLKERKDNKGMEI